MLDSFAAFFRAFPDSYTQVEHVFEDGAWTVRYWEAWVYWILFSVSVALITLHLLKRDPGLLESRLKE